MFPDIPFSGDSNTNKFFKAESSSAEFYFGPKPNGEIFRGVSMGVYENMIQNKADKLNWSTVRVSAVASKFGIPGASEANLSKAFNRTKELPTAQTALPLDQRKRHL